jgi:hypothetical protein
MNTKSTPISQLPTNNNNNTFVNDQQRQMTLQAQQAILSSSMPQNTQLSPDIVNDDDSAIQDILNQINASNNVNDNNERLQYEQALQQLRIENPQQQPINQMPPPPPMLHQQQQQLLQQQLLQQQLANLNTAETISPYKSFMSCFESDIKLASLIFFSVIVAHFTPINKFLSKYLAIDKIPYHEIIFTALLAAVFVIISKQILKI